MQLRPDELEAHARFLLALLIDTSDWVYRRVESVSFLDDQLIHRRMSMDFQFPPGYLAEIDPSPEAFAPLAFLKKQPLIKFDVRDEMGRALPVLTKEQNSEVTTLMLLALAGEVLEPQPIPAEVNDLVVQITNSEMDTSSESWQALLNLETKSQAVKSLLSNDFFFDFLKAARDNFLLVAALQERLTERRIIKYSYVQELDWDVPPPLTHRLDGSWLVRRSMWWADRIPVTLAWVPSDFDFTLPEIGLGGSYHFEVEAPDGLEIAWGQLVRDPRNIQLDQKSDPAAIAHLYTGAQDQGARGRVRFLVRARIQGVLRAALSASSFTTFLLVGGAVFPEVPRLAGDTTTTLLLALIGFVSAFIARPGENTLTTRLLLGPRILVALNGLLAYLAAIAAATDRYELWVQLGGFSGILTGALTVAILNTKSVTPSR